MSRLAKLEAVLKSFDIAEKDCVRECQAISSLKEERTKKLDQIVAQLQQTKGREKQLYRDRREATSSGNLPHLAAISRYLRKLESEVSKLGALREEAVEDVKRAEDREKLAEQDLLEVRVQRKKIEQLMAKYQLDKEIIDSARDELIIEELTSYLKSS